MKKNLIFKTLVSMRAKNPGNYFIDPDYIYDIDIEAETWDEAFEIYRQEMNVTNCILISENAVKTRKLLKADNEQLEFYMVGKAPFAEKDGSVTWKYVNLNVTVYTNVDVLTVHTKK